jgi:hypothetical protein
MQNTSLLFYITLILLLFGCSNNEENSSIKEEKTLSEKVEYYKKQIPETNTDPTNDEWKGNLYRNTLYKFRVELPKGWEQDKGAAKITLARALNREIGASIAIAVKHLPEISSNPNDITKAITKDELKNQFTELVGLQNVQFVELKIEDGYLNNFPAYLIEAKHVSSTGTEKITYLTKQIQCLNDSKIYQITLNIPVDFYNNKIDAIYKRVLQSFVFEIAY